MQLFSSQLTHQTPNHWHIHSTIPLVLSATDDAAVAIRQCPLTTITTPVTTVACPTVTQVIPPKFCLDSICPQPVEDCIILSTTTVGCPGVCCPTPPVTVKSTARCPDCRIGCATQYKTVTQGCSPIKEPVPIWAFWSQGSVGDSIRKEMTNGEKKKGERLCFHKSCSRATELCYDYLVVKKTCLTTLVSRPSPQFHWQYNPSFHTISLYTKELSIPFRPTSYPESQPNHPYHYSSSPISLILAPTFLIHFLPSKAHKLHH